MILHEGQGLNCCQGGVLVFPVSAVQRIEIFETDRLLYDVEVEAMTAWIRRLVAFDAYCARRDSRLR